MAHGVSRVEAGFSSQPRNGAKGRPRYFLQHGHPGHRRQQGAFRILFPPAPGGCCRSAPKTRLKSFLVVATALAATTSPSWFKMQ